MISPGTQVPSDTADRQRALEQKARENSITPFWTVVDQAHPTEPLSKLVPYVWRWPLLRELLDEACAVVDTSDGKAERRAFSLLNPGLGGRYGTTHTLISGVQKTMPARRRVPTATPPTLCASSSRATALTRWSRARRSRYGRAISCSHRAGACTTTETSPTARWSPGWTRSTSRW